MTVERIDKISGGRKYESVAELPEEVQAVMSGEMVLFTEDSIPYRKYIKHHSYGKYIGRMSDYKFETVAIVIDSADPTRLSESQTLIPLNGTISADLWREINDRNSESTKQYKKAKSIWKKKNNKK